MVTPHEEDSGLGGRGYDFKYPVPTAWVILKPQEHDFGELIARGLAQYGDGALNASVGRELDVVVGSRHAARV